MLKTIQKRMTVVLIVSMLLLLYVGVSLVAVAADNLSDQNVELVEGFGEDIEEEPDQNSDEGLEEEASEDIGEGAEEEPVEILMMGTEPRAEGGYTYIDENGEIKNTGDKACLLYTSPSPRDS